jgi:thioredoxin-like negative regulator of GroEL
MKLSLKYVWMIALWTVCPLLVPDSGLAQGISWRQDYAAARKEAKAKGLPLVLDFGTENCFWCVKLERETFADANIARMMNEQFIPLKINAHFEPQLAEALRIQSYPTVVLADADGRILGTMEGFQEAPRFYENLQRALARVANPEWMIRDYQSANKALGASDYAKAISLLKNILDDGKTRPIQKKARELMDQIEDQATQLLVRAKQFNQDGKTTEALNVLTQLVREYTGTSSAVQAGQFLTQQTKTPVTVEKARGQVARELLAQAREYYRTQKFLYCLDHCKKLIEEFGDLKEAETAREMQGAIQTNTVWMQKNCDELGERLGNMLFLLADTHLKNGDRQKALETYQRVVATFPGSHHAMVADVRLRQLQGEATVNVDFQKNPTP